jgi:hypothetical protein
LNLQYGKTMNGDAILFWTFLETLRYYSSRVFCFESNFISRLMPSSRVLGYLATRVTINDHLRENTRPVAHANSLCSRSGGSRISTGPTGPQYVYLRHSAIHHSVLSRVPHRCNRGYKQRGTPTATARRIQTKYQLDTTKHNQAVHSRRLVSATIGSRSEFAIASQSGLEDEKPTRSWFTRSPFGPPG